MLIGYLFENILLKFKEEFTLLPSVRSFECPKISSLEYLPWLSGPDEKYLSFPLSVLYSFYKLRIIVIVQLCKIAHPWAKHISEVVLQIQFSSSAFWHCCWDAKLLHCFYLVNLLHNILYQICRPNFDTKSTDGIFPVALMPTKPLFEISWQILTYQKIAVV